MYIFLENECAFKHLYQTVGYACYVPEKYNVCCDNMCCMALQCRLDLATCCPQLCSPDACCGINGQCACVPICLKCCATNECDCDALCKTCPIPCPEFCMPYMPYCSLCMTQKCHEIDCDALCKTCGIPCPEFCISCMPWCKFCAACAVQDCNACIELHPPQCDPCCPPCKMCCGPDTGTWCAYRMTWLPQWCCCKNSGCLLACPIAPTAIKQYCTCCNDMNDGDKKYKFGGLPPPHGNGGLPNIRGPQGPPTSFFGGEAEIAPAKA